MYVREACIYARVPNAILTIFFRLYRILYVLSCLNINYEHVPLCMKYTGPSYTDFFIFYWPESRLHVHISFPPSVNSYVALDSGAAVIKTLLAEFLHNLLQPAPNLVDLWKNYQNRYWAVNFAPNVVVLCNLLKLAGFSLQKISLIYAGEQSSSNHQSQKIRAGQSHRRPTRSLPLIWLSVQLGRSVCSSMSLRPGRAVCGGRSRLGWSGMTGTWAAACEVPSGGTGCRQQRTCFI
jgi:hypothetical protein